MNDTIIAAARLKAGETILLLVEEPLAGKETAELFEALKAQAAARMMVHPAKTAYESQYTTETLAAMEQADVIVEVCVFTDMYSTLKQRLLQNGKRIICFLCPAGGGMGLHQYTGTQLQDILKQTEGVGAFFSRSTHITLRSAAGQLSFRLEPNRRLIRDGLPPQKGQDSVLPPASVTCVPVEGSAEGELHLRGFVETVIGEDRRVEAECTIYLQGGKVSFSGTDAEKVGTVFQGCDRSTWELGHVTVGTNRFMGKVTEGFLAERALGGLCLGFGNNLLLGGANSADGHVDVAAVVGMELENEKGERMRLLSGGCL